jgi:hypothetical protein
MTQDKMESKTLQSENLLVSVALKALQAAMKMLQAVQR